MTDMRFRQLGNSGLTVSVVGLGCNNFGSRTDPEASRAVIEAALDAGITLFDTADIYGNRGGSETILGDVLKGRRDDVILATKFGMRMGDGDYDYGGSRWYIRRAVDASLRRLQTDFIDLYQYHAPDPRTPLDETIAALDELVSEGKVRYVGSSNFSGWQIADADWIARTEHRTRLVSAQNHYSLLVRDVEAEVIPACERFGVGMLPYFPLANGLLTGKYRRGEPAPKGTRLAMRGGHLMTDDNFDLVDSLERYADERGVSLLHVAIGGLAAQRAVSSVIAGATKPDQVRANVEAGSWEPTPDDLATLDAIVPSARQS
jgi:aryl-alcohol dehydrogenase-like predicted oxidoreductase